MKGNKNLKNSTIQPTKDTQDTQDRKSCQEGDNTRNDEGREDNRRKDHEGRPQDHNLNMVIAFDIGAGIMLAMGTDTCKSKGERVSKRSEPTLKKMGRFRIS